ncbi:SusC/RagA family TonB-linked outer membrane protein [Sphingobacterium psychroaquaticum]|uniref:TonB-linked outer membrane protein, SusC/RagA family n=1 Tax=Sphingobacterium psychroaquaticum TaxID=561061 RepID=A0A1X7JKZ9_9SPHI|nr:TonB-dependent receptor [Sphingobacterium psychroaquaticum]SMG28480.1 TonB-linked outer membrane protein, SusC/RagA family [Sphingobacterium psychroaquaticum]
MRKIITSLFPVLLLLITTNSALAQQRVIQGTVIDASSQKPLAGVNVQITGQRQSAVTSTDGTYRVTTDLSNGTLEFSYIGYETARIPLSSTNFDIGLNIASKDLGEVVVVAYGTSRKDNITGSISTINNKQIENRQVSSISKALEGQVPGLQSVSASGQPGTDATIRIRGIGSINASAAPLYVVDGSPYAGDINALNPNDIQSISVLKDAAASVLYGSRGANGVIIITTKNGRSGEKTAINLNFTQGATNRAVRDYDQVSTDDYFKLYWQALRNKNVANGLTPENAARNASATIVTDLGINPYGAAFPQPIGTDGQLVAGATPLWNDNWSDVLQRTGSRTQGDLSFSGGTDKNTYFISGGYLNDQGIAIESSFKRYNVRANIDAKVRSWLNTGISIAGSSTQQKYPQSEDSNTANIINFTRLVPSFYPYYKRKPDGSYELDENNEKIYDFGAYRPSAAIPRNNLAASLPLDKNDINRENLALRTYLEGVITENLKFRSTYSVDYINSNTHYYTNPSVGGGASYLGSVSKSNVRTVAQTWNNILTYDKQIGDHHINILGGQEYYDFNSANISGSRERFVLPGLYEPVAASQLNSFTGSSSNYRLLSFLGRAEYGYANRYLLSASLRTDGSSRFAPETRWGTFWSVGGSWKLAEEPFIKNSNIFNQLTLRASYGGQGNDNLGTYFAYQGLYTIANSLGQGGTLTSRLPTPELKWETNLNFNAGLDVAILKNRLAFSVEFFNRQSKDLLFTMPMALSTGYSGYDANIGSMKNTGIDVDIRTIPIRKGDFRWNLDLNFSHYRNKITELPTKENITSGNKLLRVGGSIYDFNIPEWAGVNPENGNPQWYLADANGNKTDQKTSEYGKAGLFIQGSSIPDLVGGINNTITYKGFDFSALLSFSIGGKVLDNDYIQLMHNGSNIGRAWSKEILNHWTPENTITDVPRLTTDNLNWTSASSRFLYSATYARLKNINIGYTLPEQTSNRIGIRKLRVFALAENVLTFYGHQGMDPEQTINGATYFRYPAIRTVSGGIQLAF